MQKAEPSRPDPSRHHSGIALVTGAARRIGRTIAIDLAKSGWNLAIHYCSSGDDAKSLAEEIEMLGAKAILLKTRLTDADAVQTLIPRCVEMLGAPTCLVNNASLFLPDTLATLDAKSWQDHMDANLRAPILLSQSFAEALPKTAHGNIINIIDQRVLAPKPDFFSYSVSKAGLWWATRTMAQTLAPRIRVNAVAPGPVLPSIHQTSEEFHAESQATLLKHSAMPEDIAAAVRFLIDSPAITGQMITVDSGQHLT